MSSVQVILSSPAAAKSHRRPTPRKTCRWGGLNHQCRRRKTRPHQVPPPRLPKPGRSKETHPIRLPRHHPRSQNQIENRKSRIEIPWPKSLPEQTRALRDLLAAAPPAGLTPDQLFTRFKGSSIKNKEERTQRIIEILDTLPALNQARRPDDDHYAPL